MLQLASPQTVDALRACLPERTHADVSGAEISAAYGNDDEALLRVALNPVGAMAPLSTILHLTEQQIDGLVWDGVAACELDESLPKESWLHIVRSVGQLHVSIFDIDEELRGVLRGGARAGTRRETAPVPSEQPNVDRVRDIVADVTGYPVEEVPADQRLIEIGIDSITTAELCARFKEVWNASLTIKQVIDAPSLAALTDVISSEQDAQRDAQLPALVPDLTTRHEPFPLNEIQYAYLVGRTAAVDWVSTPTHFYFEFDGSLDAARLEAAWNQVIARHDVLRVEFLANGEQRIREEVPAYQIRVQDLRAASDEAMAQTLVETHRDMSCNAPAIDTWPHFDIALSELPDGRTRLHVNVDMMIADLFSMGIVFREWGQFYDDPAVVLEPLELSYRDYILAEREIHGSDYAAESRAYWAERMHQLPPAPVLPRAEMADPAVIRRPDCGHLDHRVEAEQWGSLKRLSAEYGLTPASVVCTAFSEVLASWAKDPSFTINVTQFRRYPLHQQVNQLVGDFTSTILLGIDGRSAPTFGERAQILATQMWNDLDHSDIGGVSVLSELTRARGERVLMPVVFTSGLDDLEPPTRWAGGLRRLDGETSQVLLDCHIHEYHGGLNIVWDVVEEAFPDGLLEEMFAALKQVLAQLASGPEAWQGNPLDAEIAARWEASARYNDTDADFGTGLLHTMGLEQAARRPDAPAVITGSETLSFGELFARVENTAGALLRQGVRPGDRVGVAVTPGWEGVVATYAILAVGGVYVAVDPSSPAERIRYSLEKADVSVVLTLGWLGDNLDWPSGITRLFVDEVAHVAPTEPVDLRAEHREPTDLAYIIYTSGSTGRPKGVMIDHRGARNTCIDINQRFDVTENDRVLAISKLSFDLSVYDVFGVLGAGGALVYPEYSVSPDPSVWVQAMNDHGVTMWNTVPALMTMLVDVIESDAAAVDSLRVALLSGDWIPLSLPDRIDAAANGCQVISLGGATEGSIWSIFHPIEEISPDWVSIPYGRPLANQRFFVLDQELQPCPNWSTGELYIGGTGVAMGYVGEEALTAERFITHPTLGERIYRTGDLGCFRSDGTIQFQGREDSQVKIRGFRVELEEIQSQLDRHPDVQESHVALQSLSTGSAHPAQATGADTQHIVAFAVPSRDAGFDEAALIEFLARELPEYMIPSRIMRIEEIPLTANGKVNRGALPQIEFGTSEGAVLTPPTTPAERAVAEAWSELLALPIERFGIDDNFFDVGGTSLLIVRLSTAIEARTGVKLGVLDLFEFSTVRKMAAAVDRDGAVGAEPAVPDRAAKRAERRNELRARRRSR